MSEFATLLYGKDSRNPRIARITLNRPERLNAISPQMPGEIRGAVQRANDDDEVHVIVVQGAGRAFCAGYDMKESAERPGEHEWLQTEMPWDPMVDYRWMKGATDDIMSLWRSYKPTICRVQQYAVAGGSDIALSCDLLVLEKTARIGYMPTRVWGCPSTAMWLYRVGMQRAKRLLFTGDTIDGATAKEWGLAIDAVEPQELDAAVDALAERIAGVPRSMLMMQKLMINQAYENMGLASTQMIATVFDGITRHNPEGVWFRAHAEKHGFHSAVEWRDSGQPIPEGEEARRTVRELRGQTK
ncbi:MAG: crotonase/enoyl-CoA hydratase family protein [Gemmatimonadota bacterium]